MQYATNMKTRLGGVLAISLSMFAGCNTLDEPGVAGRGSDEPPRALEAQASCSYAPLNGRATVAITAQAAPTVVPERSLIVTAPAGFASVEAPFTLGRQLEDLGNYINYRVCLEGEAPEHKPKDIPTFVHNAFVVGARDIDDHNAWTGVKLGSVATIRNTFQTRILDAWPDADANGPFRLLAVINRLDVAGDEDTRGGGQLAGAERRWFGEGRLVFGLARDLDAKTPYPMTLIMEYRLPALKATVNGDTTTYEVDPSFDFVGGPVDNAAWRAGRAHWANIWRELSRYAPTDPKYQAMLLKIVKLFATGENHVALRTGERTYDMAANAFTSEFEYREFYLNDTWNLSTRKMRREPIRCAQGSATLKNRIEEEWNVPANDFHFTFMLGERRLDDDTEVKELSDRCGDGKYVSPDGMPYGQDLGSGGYGMRAKFSRFTPKQVWTLKNETEDRRHKLGANTCSGCHGSETANTGGFHIFPRLAGAESQRSAMLRGVVTATPNGTQYTIDEIGDRTTKLTNFASGYNYAKDYPANHTHEELYCNASPCAATTYPE